ncbi:sarcosine oxidase subunit gamma [Roseovarius litorisediminis]|uniref:sarcosine oxidase subunit gamma n=1 Tax=Roseovarius litorisediminis TaxID=1312363 RepID=UPI000A26E4B3|nr:sarcosine oxidase subunit gamma [Roseovarius litorisediminis]
MPDYTLTSAPPLAGTDITIGGARLTAPADLAVVSIALPLGGEAAAQKAIKTAFGTALPEVGKSAIGKNGARLVRLGRDQAFVLFIHATPDAEAVVAARLKGKAYTTDQTDVWCALEISGPDSRAALERICPLDLHPQAFAVDDAARTSMEHLGTLTIRTGENAYLLMSASSSAGSFLHAVETSIKNIN